MEQVRITNEGEYTCIAPDGKVFSLHFPELEWIVSGYGKKGEPLWISRPVTDEVKAARRVVALDMCLGLYDKRMEGNK